MKVVYTMEDGMVAVLTPTQEILKMAPVEISAQAVVPENIPFWIVDDSEIPEDRTFRNAWEIPAEWGDPSGYGSKFNTFKEMMDACN